VVAALLVGVQTLEHGLGLLNHAVQVGDVAQSGSLLAAVLERKPGSEVHSTRLYTMRPDAVDPDTVAFPELRMAVRYSSPVAKD
jgi:hypothetical protein